MNRPSNLTYNDLTICDFVFIICMNEWTVHDFYFFILQNKWFIHDVLSLYVRLNGLFMTLCHYMSGWKVCSWFYIIICQVEWSVHDLCHYMVMNSPFIHTDDENKVTNGTFNLTYNDIKSWTDHPTWHIMT
jgi:hypothetical protein